MSLRTWLVAELRRLASRPLTLGERGERVAAAHLRRQGLRIVARRSRVRYGEIDLVAVEGRTVVFVEVKTRRSDRHGAPALAVDAHRRRRLTRAATAYLKAHDLLAYAARFDVIEVVWPLDRRAPEVRWHRNAFAAEGAASFFA
jgi:putative endonuclease